MADEMALSRPCHYARSWYLDLSWYTCENARRAEELFLGHYDLLAIRPLPLSPSTLIFRHLFTPFPPMCRVSCSCQAVTRSQSDGDNVFSGLSLMPGQSSSPGSCPLHIPGGRRAKKSALRIPEWSPSSVLAKRLKDSLWRADGIQLFLPSMADYASLAQRAIIRCAS